MRLAVRAVVLAITTITFAVDVAGWVGSGSLALLPDAAGLVVALIAAALAVRRVTDSRPGSTGGRRSLRATRLAAVLLAVG